MSAGVAVVQPRTSHVMATDRVTRPVRLIVSECFDGLTITPLIPIAPASPWIVASTRLCFDTLTPVTATARRGLRRVHGLSWVLG